MWPTSVMFFTWVTRRPVYSKVRRSQSASRYERRFPRCTGRYTVGPQVYMRTSPWVSGTNGSTRRVSVLNRLSCTVLPLRTGYLRGLFPQHALDDLDRRRDRGAIARRLRLEPSLDLRDTHLPAFREHPASFGGHRHADHARVRAVANTAHQPGALHLRPERAHGRRPYLLRRRQLAQRPLPAHQDRPPGALRPG